MNPPESMAPLHRFPRMMQEYLTARLRANYRANHARVMALNSPEDAKAYCAAVRTQTAGLFGPWPERTPLNLRITGCHDRGVYEIRNVVFDSRPGFPVTANLYLPRGHSGPRPAVLCLCGHHWQAKANVPYQSSAQALARMGYVTLIFDPMGQGERVQYPDGRGGSLYGPGPRYPSTREHNAIDRQMALVGDWIGRWFVWDGMRALDVLLAQEQVDPSRVGVTGNSGGGTLSAYAVACDSRITMAAPSCWISSWQHDAINEEPLDGEQCPPGILAAGLEQSDLLLARAPNPVIILGQAQDFFDPRGTHEAVTRVRHVYRLLGAEANVAFHMGPGEHGFWIDAREAMYAFFNRHAGINHPGREPDLVIETAATLQVTPTGQVSDLPATQCVPAFTQARARQLATMRGRPVGADLKRRVEALLNLPRRLSPPDYRILRPWSARHYARPFANHCVLETDGEHGAQVVVTQLEDAYRSGGPRRGDGPALLYLPHVSSDQEMREDERIRALEMANPAFFACDYRGIGESRPDTCRPDSFFDIYGSDYHSASNAIMLGASCLAWRVHDVLSTLDWMGMFGYDQVHLVAQGWGTLPGALAGLLDPRIQRVTLIHAPQGFAEWAGAPLQEWPLSAMLPGVLTQFDLPDVYLALADKHLELIEPWNAGMKAMP